MSARQASLLTTGDIGRLVRVDPRTVTRWAKAGKIRGFKTSTRPHAHWRFHLSEARRLLAELGIENSL